MLGLRNNLFYINWRYFYYEPTNCFHCTAKCKKNVDLLAGAFLDRWDEEESIKRLNTIMRWFEHRKGNITKFIVAECPSIFANFDVVNKAIVAVDIISPQTYRMPFPSCGSWGKNFPICKMLTRHVPPHGIPSGNRTELFLALSRPYTPRKYDSVFYSFIHRIYEYTSVVPQFYSSFLQVAYEKSYRVNTSPRHLISQE